MKNTILKLKSIELDNFKNVKHGKIDLKEDKINNKISNILGIYGQNGSGKTSIINALYLLKLVVCGKELNENIHNYICSNEEATSLGFEFRLYEGNEEYKIYYKFEIRRKQRAICENGYDDAYYSDTYYNGAYIDENYCNGITYYSNDVSGHAHNNIYRHASSNAFSHTPNNMNSDISSNMSSGSMNGEMNNGNSDAMNGEMNDRTSGATNGYMNNVISNATSGYMNDSISDENVMTGPINFGKEMDTRVEISKEKLSFSKLENNQWKNRVTIIDYDVDDEDYTFRPIKNYREVANTNSKKVNLGIAKGLSQEKSTSFIFSSKSLPMLLQSFSKNSKDYSDIIMSLRTFALFNLFVIQNDDLGAININLLMPFSYMLKNERGGMRGNIPIKLFETSVIEIDSFDIVKKVLEQINVVIKTIVPKLKIQLKNYGKETMANGKEGYKVELLSVREKTIIPLKYESDGIKKIISIMSVLIGMFNNENIIVAIDELDAGVFEYLLGEILEILSKSAQGQLIFTSHNLRALEKLNKDLVVFTTTNPENRYISLSNVKGTNNLRDFYYRGIILGGQREELYDQTNKYEMSYAFKKAWMMSHEESHNI